MNAGFCSLRTRTSVEERPSARDAYAFPNAISKRTIEDPSSFWNALTMQPGSTTTTLKGRHSSSAPRLMIVSMIRLACSSVMELMRLLCLHNDLLRLQSSGLDDRDQTLSLRCKKCLCTGRAGIGSGFQPGRS